MYETKKQNTHYDVIDRLFPLSVQQVANQLGETKYVIQNWTRDLRPFIPIHKNQSGYNVFYKDGFTVFALIQYLHRDLGYSLKQVKDFFMKEFHEVPFLKQIEQVLIHRYPNLLDRKALQKAFAGTIYYDDYDSLSKSVPFFHHQNGEFKTTNQMEPSINPIELYRELFESFYQIYNEQFTLQQKQTVEKIQTVLKEFDKQMNKQMMLQEKKIKELESKIDYLTEINKYLYHSTNKYILTSSSKKKKSIWKRMKRAINITLTWLFRIK